jgi:hypothetical protein
MFGPIKQDQLYEVNMQQKTIFSKKKRQKTTLEMQHLFGSLFYPKTKNL